MLASPLSVRWVQSVSVILLILLGFATSPAARGEEVTLIVGGKVFDTTKGEFVDNPGILIQFGRIVSLDESEGEATERVQLEDGQFILPGLIDLHAHYNVRLFRNRREEFDVNPVLFLANGVTMTFSAGEYDPEGMLELKRQVESGERVGPKILNSGPYFGMARPGWRSNRPSREQIYEEVDHWARMGVGGFKAKLIDADSLQALIDRAHLHDLTVTGHLESGYRNSVNPRDAIDMGIDRIEHFLGGDAVVDTRPAYQSVAELTPDHPDFKAIVKKYIETGTYYDATITAFGYFGNRGEEFGHWFDENSLFTPYVREQLETRTYRPTELFERVYQSKQKLILAYYEAGGKITLGTDHFSSGDFVSGFCAHRELDAFVRSGIPAAEAIKIGTINGATAMGLEKDYGSIEVGKVADLFVVDGNPLDDIRNTRNIQLVVREGKCYDPEVLLESVKGKLGPKNAEEAEAW